MVARSRPSPLRWKGNLVDIHLFNADPFPRWSVHVRTTCTLVLPFLGSSPTNSLRLRKTAKASRVDIIRDGLSPLSQIHGPPSQFEAEPGRKPRIQFAFSVPHQGPTTDAGPSLASLRVDPRSRSQSVLPDEARRT